MPDARDERRAGVAAKVMLLLVSSLTVLAGAIVAPSLPGLRTAFAGAPGIDLLSRLVLTAPALAVAVSAGPVGWLTDAIGRKRVLLAGLVIYAAGGSSGVYAQSIALLIAGRVVLGIGVATTLTCVSALIADYFSGEARARLIGQQGAAMGFGGMLFLTSGGALADVSWRAPFSTYLVALLLAPACALVLHEPVRSHEHGSDEHAPSGVPRSLLVVLYGAAAMGFVLFYLIPVQLPFSLTALGASGTEIGLAIGAMTLLSSMSSLLYARLARRFGPRAILSGAFFAMAPGLGLIASAESYRELFVALLVIAPPLGQLMPNLVSWLATVSPARSRGRVLGGLNVAVFTGQFLSPIAAAPFVARGGLHGTNGAFAAASVAAFVTGAATLVLTRRSPM